MGRRPDDDPSVTVRKPNGHRVASAYYDVETGKRRTVIKKIGGNPDLPECLNGLDFNMDNEGVMVIDGVEILQVKSEYQARRDNKDKRFEFFPKCELFGVTKNLAEELEGHPRYL